jgi:hypothetical protein
MLRDGHYVNKTTLVFRHHSEPERVVNSPKPYGELLITPWRCSQEVLAAEITDRSSLHWRHSFVDFNVVKVLLLRGRHVSATSCCSDISFFFFFPS